MLYRVQEWLADRTRFVQYPRLRRIVPTDRRPARAGIWGKLALAYIAIPLFVVGAVGAVASLFMLWLIWSTVLAG